MPIHTSSENTAAVANDPQARVITLLAGKQIGIAQAGRRGDGEAEIEIFPPRELIVTQEVSAAAGPQLLEDRGFHRKPRDHAGNMVW